MQRTKTTINPFGLPNIVIPAEILFHEKLSWREKSLFGFLLNLCSNEKGYCWASNRYLAALINTRPDTVSGMVSNLNDHQYITLEYEVVPDPDGATKQVRKITINKEYPKIYKGLLQGVLGKIQTLGKITKPPRENNQTPLGKSPSNIDNTIRENNIDTSSVEDEEISYKDKKITTSQFEDFWTRYPQSRRIDKGKAKTAWEKICNRPLSKRPTWTEIKQALARQRKSERWQNSQYIPHPTTWLNQQRWLDDPKEMGLIEREQDKPVKNRNYIELIEDEFPQKDMMNAFMHTCWKPASFYFDGVDSYDLTQALIDFYNMIKEVQEKHLVGDLRRLMPGPMTVIRDYITWLDDVSQDWIESRGVNLLQKGSKPFISFRKNWALEVDSMGRDPLTGVSKTHD